MQRSAYAPAAVLPDYVGGAEHASVTEAIRNAKLVVVSCRPGVFDLDAVKETIEFAREEFDAGSYAAAKMGRLWAANRKVGEGDPRRACERRHASRRGLTGVEACAPAALVAGIHALG
jgi:hypothetical protein